MLCSNCRQPIEWCDYHGWEGTDSSTFCDWEYQPGGTFNGYTVEHSPYYN